MNWDEYFVSMASFVSEKSKDDSTKVGCVIVAPDHTILATGYNGFPRGIRELELIKCDNCVGFGNVEFYPLNKVVCPECGGAGEVLGKNLEPERWHKRPEKYSWVEHAERNAIYNAARNGVALKGSIAYLNWEPKPCEPCTRALIQAGIVEIVGPDIPFGGVGNKKYYDTDGISAEMLDEAKIIRRVLN